MTLPVRQFSAAGYRSLRDIRCPVGDLEVFVGGNGVGKTNLYRALQLLQSAAANTLGLDLAREGGLASAFWAGDRRKGPARITLSVGLADPERPRAAGVACLYEVEVGYCPPGAAGFEQEPQIKVETLSWRTSARRVNLLERRGTSVTARNEDGRPVEIDIDLTPSETALGRLEDPSRYPELDLMRRTLLQWRFYHDLRTDESSPLRRPCLAVTSPTLASDGSNLAAVFATLVHIREDSRDLDRIIDDAFPGARLVVPAPGSHASFGMTFPEFPRRVFEASELSDGTLRFLALAGALMAYRLPPFVALNEPEASLHPSLTEPLARLVAEASRRSQLWLVTHSERLADAIVEAGGGAARTVVKREGATWVEGLTRVGDWEEEEDEG